MDFSYTQEQMIFEEALKKFVKKEIIPVCLDFEDDTDGKLAHSVITKAAKAGILGTVVPEQYGGGGGRGMEANIALENLAYGDVGIACAIGASWWGQTALLTTGAPELKSEWFPKFASQEKAHLVCMALTEPSGGTNVEGPGDGIQDPSHYCHYRRKRGRAKGAKDVAEQLRCGLVVCGGLHCKP